MRRPELKTIVTVCGVLVAGDSNREGARRVLFLATDDEDEYKVKSPMDLTTLVGAEIAATGTITKGKLQDTIVVRRLKVLRHSHSPIISESEEDFYDDELGRDWECMQME